MAIAYTIKQYLDNNRIVYTVLDLPEITSLAQAATAAGIPPRSLAQTVLLKDQIGLVMAVMPITHELDIDALCKMLHRKLEPAQDMQITAIFRDCKPGFIPPLGEAYGVRAIIDDSLIQSGDICFTSGSPAHLVKVTSKSFHIMQRNAWLGGSFARPVAALDDGAAASGGAQEAAQKESDRALDIKHRIERMGALPALPEMALKIIQLSTSPNARADDLARLVEMDPALAAQVMRYASSSFFGYQGRVDSVRVAIARVLGYEMVMNLALGLATAKPFKIPQHGPLGLGAFWRHATYSAALMQALGKAMPEPIRPRAGLSYLAGLLHNIGHLLMGGLFKQEFLQLNDLVGKNPEKSILALEIETLGVNHGQMGAWLTEAWRLPEEIIVTAREHHNEAYVGPHATYANLALIADRMLKTHGIGEGEGHDLPPAILQALQLDEVQIIMVMNRVLEGCEGLDAMAQQMAV